jgi:hypothetical protein
MLLQPHRSPLHSYKQPRPFARPRTLPNTNVATQRTFSSRTSDQQQLLQQEQKQLKGVVTKQQLLHHIVSRRWHESDQKLDVARRALALLLVRHKQWPADGREYDAEKGN